MYNFNVMLEGFVLKKCLRKYIFCVKLAYLNKKEGFVLSEAFFENWFKN